MESNHIADFKPRFQNVKVTHVLYSGLGGHSAMLFALLENGFMQGANHDILFIGDETPPNEYIDKCHNLHATWTYLPKLPGKFHLKFMLAVERKLSAKRSKVIFMHGLAAIPSMVFSKIFRSGAAPFVIVRETQANQLKTIRNWISLIFAYWFVNIVVHLTKEAAEGSIRKLKFISRRKKVHVVPNGLDTEFFTPSRKKICGDGVVHIGMQSRLQANKDHKTLISAFYLLCKRYPSKSFHLHIAGDGSTYEPIQQMIKELGLSTATTMHGMIDRVHLRDFLNRLDIYVHCTYGETMSTAIMQALSCGLPVIASDVEGVSNMVQPDVGMLYRPEDANDLFEKINFFICNPNEMYKWGRCARSYAVKSYTISATIRAYENLISLD